MRSIVRLLLLLTIEIVTAGGAPALADVSQGIVVEAVSRNSASQKAGLLRGDVLIGWIQGEASGSIRSPFDLEVAETERSPRGLVTLQGLRDNRARTWLLGPGKWGLQARPTLASAVLARYYQCAHLEEQGKLSQAAEKCKEASVALSSSSSVTAKWLMLRAASLWSRDAKYKEADQFYQALTDLAPQQKALVLWEWAHSFQRRHDWSNTIDRYERAITEAENASAPLMAAALEDDFGMMSWMRADLKRAELHCRRSLDIRRELASGSLALAQSFVSVGTVVRYTRGPGLQEGEQYYRQAFVIADKLDPDGLEVAAILRNLGIIAWQQGSLADSQKSLRHALEIEARLAPGGLEFASTLNELGTVAGS
jgi:tetratricopeptide (TPR) repeat protein